MPPESNNPKDFKSSLREELRAMFREVLTPDVLAALVKESLKENGNLISADDGETPRGWKRSTNAPYYKESFALEMKELFDQMMMDGKPIMFLYSDLPNETSRASLSARLLQSTLYLIERMDTADKKYATFRNTVEFNKSLTEDGIVIQAKKIVNNPENKLIARPMEYKPNTSIFKNELNEWLESAPRGDRNKWEGLSLSVESYKELKDELQAMANDGIITFSLDQNKLIIGKNP